MRGSQTYIQGYYHFTSYANQLNTSHLGYDDFGDEIISMSDSISSKSHCPYLKYGQCIVAPKEIARIVVDRSRCYNSWKSCNFYLKARKLEDSKTSTTSNIGLDEFMRNNVVEETINHSEDKCPLLVNNICIARGSRVPPSHLKLCYNYWRECPDRRRYMLVHGKSKSLADIIKYILTEQQ